MSAPFDPPNPFDHFDKFDARNPFADVQRPSEWQSFKERTEQERLQRRHTLIAVLLAYVCVTLAASIAASLGMDNGAFFAALKAAALGGFCGGGISVAFAMLAATGAGRLLMPVHVAALMPKTPAPRGVPVIMPLALVGAMGGIFMFTTLGATLGADTTGAGDSSATISRAFLGGALGMLLVGLWWARTRRQAGQDIGKLRVVLIAALVFISLLTILGLATGSLQPVHSYLSLCGRGYDRQLKGDPRGAIADFNKAIDMNPKRYLAYWRRFHLLLEQGKDAEAEKDLQRCIDLEPRMKDELEHDFEASKRRRENL